MYRVNNNSAASTLIIRDQDKEEYGGILLEMNGDFVV